MFDIAWSELFVILIVALVVVGPKDLPKLMRKVGQWTGRARTMADQFRRSFDDMARQAELDELRSEVNKMKAVATNPMTDADYANLGIEFPKDPLGIKSHIEDVGAAPPVLDSPPTAPSAAVPVAPSAVAPNTAPPPAGMPTPAVPSSGSAAKDTV
jgi:sec-independent protein translocase protein TatB